MRKAWIAAALALAAVRPIAPAAAQDAPAGTLGDLRRDLSVCVGSPAASPGSEITVLFSLRRDGSLLGQPRITHSTLLGDPAAQRAFVAEAIAALANCLPARVTDGLGGAIAGRLFSIRIGRRPREPEALRDRTAAVERARPTGVAWDAARRDFVGSRGVGLVERLPRGAGDLIAPAALGAIERPVGEEHQRLDRTV